jgi:2-dehydropantoate 2-reductase
MRIAIFGAGGVGGYFGGRLAQAGEEVVFIARGKHLQALKNKGLKVESIKGDFDISPVQASSDPSDFGAVDVVLVAVKAWQIPDAAQAMRPLIGPETMVVPLLNGVEAPAQLSKVLGADHVIGGFCGVISYVASPGVIRHVGADPFVKFGELDNRQSARVKKLHETFTSARGVTVQIPENIHVAMWNKFLLIVPWSGIGSITRAPLGIFLSLPQTHQMLLTAMQEVINVAAAQNIILPEGSAANTLEFLENLPPDGTASMQRDIMEGRPSELESQVGAIVRMGQELDVNTPVNSLIYQSLLPQELLARGQLNIGD